MATKAQLAQSAWSTVAGGVTADGVTFYTVLRDNTPWFVVAPSAALKHVGKHGWGVYAAVVMRKPVKFERYLAMYEGEETHFSSFEELSESRTVAQKVREGHDRMLAVRGLYGGYVLIDAHSTHGSWIHLMNAANNTGISTNAMFEGRYIKLKRTIAAFNPKKSIADNMVSEVLVSYGKGYWKAQASGDVISISSSPDEAIVAPRPTASLAIPPLPAPEGDDNDVLIVDQYGAPLREGDTPSGEVDSDDELLVNIRHPAA